VNYRALALAVKALGVKACFSTAAVGSIRSEWPPETLAICADILDFTGRNITLFDRTVQHTPIQEPFDNRLRRILIEAVISAGGRAHDGAIYGCMNGPRFETPQEIRVVRQLGVDIVGMTAASEAVVMREIGVAYACLAIVTNYAAGFEGGQPLHTDVEDVMSTQGELVIEILRQAAASA
jgi:5'-methylthioadenosine phosphorylase